MRKESKMNRLLVVAAAGVSAGLAPSVASAAPLYWSATGGTGTAPTLYTWSTASYWYTDAAKTTVSSAAPTASDDVFFNTTPDNTAGGTVTVGANIAAKSLTFNTSAATTLSQNANRIFTLGTGGITVNSGAGNASVGVSSNSLAVELTGSQTWTNNATSTLNVRLLRVSNTASGATTLTLNAVTSGGITFNLSAGDSLDASKSLAIVVDSAGTGATTLVGSTYTGGTTIKRGRLNTNGTLGSAGIVLGESSSAENVRLHLSGAVGNAVTVGSGTGTRTISGSTNSDVQGALTLNKDIVVASDSTTSQTIKLSGAISGSGGITVDRLNTSAPVVLISGNNSYTGKTTVNTGTLEVQSLNRVSGGVATSSLGAPTTAENGKLTFSAVGSSTLRYVGTGETTDREIEYYQATGALTIDQNGAGALKFDGGITSLGTTTTSRSIVLQGSTSGTGEIAGVINDVDGTGITSVSQTGTGTWRLSNVANTYAGATNFGVSGVGGVLEVVKLRDGGLSSSVGQSSSAGSGMVFSGGTLRYIGGGDSTNRTFTLGGAGGTLDASGTGAIVFTTSTVPSYGTAGIAIGLTLTGGNVSDNTYSANLNNNGAGAVSITKNGEGTWVLAGTSTYTGGTTINAGTLKVTGALANTGAVNIAGGTYQVANTDTVGAVTLTSGVITGSGTLTGSSYAVSAGSISAILSGTAALTKSTGGTVTITGNANYTGATAVNAGKLVVGNGISGSLGNTAVTVASDATLGGSGSIVGGVTLSTGGILAPGNSIGTLSTGALDLGTGTFAVEINTSALTSDRAAVTGNLALAGAVLTLTDLGSNVSLAPDQVFTLVTYTGEWNNGEFTYNASSLADGSTFTFGANQYRINYDNSNAVTLTVVPEPAMLSLLGATALGVLRRRRTN